ncbi:MAG: hypothetical protein CFH10_00398 [Alphaproteobacteria bacterium MarineAlpha4_Bin2]|nr:MAG: hypothetical protein CFH10_00398 [Alphaproteobacteria bacterium MarineAlpha4_Bin2]
MITTGGMQDGEIKDISEGGTAIVGRGSLQIGVGDPIELRVENFEKISGHVVRAGENNEFAIAFDINGTMARKVFADITKKSKIT